MHLQPGYYSKRVDSGLATNTKKNLRSRAVEFQPFAKQILFGAADLSILSGRGGSHVHAIAQTTNQRAQKSCLS